MAQFINDIEKEDDPEMLRALLTSTNDINKEMKVPLNVMVDALKRSTFLVATSLSNQPHSPYACTAYMTWKPRQMLKPKEKWKMDYRGLMRSASFHLHPIHPSIYPSIPSMMF